MILGNSAYGPSKETGKFDQPQLTAALLSQIAKANYPVLSKLRLSKEHNLPVPVQSNISLDRFAMMGAQDPDIACEVFAALWTELTSPSQSGEGLSRPPVVFTVDSIAHMMRETEYLDTEVKPIHAHNFTLVSHFLQLLANKHKLPNGALILAADSASNRPSLPGFDHAIARNAAQAAKLPLPKWNPWIQVDQRTIDCLDGVDVWQIKGLSREEARAMLEYYAKSGMVRQTVDDLFVGEKWTLSGGGIVGELEKASVRTRI